MAPSFTSRSGSDAALITDPGVAREFASELIAKWPQAEPLNARKVLALHPELGHFQSIVADLAHEEFAQRRAAGELVDPEQFAAGFPEARDQLLKLIALNRYLESQIQMLGTTQVAWPAVHSRLLGFELQEELGRGAFSRVFLATETALGGRRVVVKVARRGSLEAQTLGVLQHPHIVPVYSVQKDPQSGLTAICMPFLGRTTLFDVLNAAGKRLETGSHADLMRDTVAASNHAAQATHAWGLPRNYDDAVIRIGAQLASAIAYTHQHEFYHRDIKPSNVLLTNDGRALLFDFNLSFSRETARFQVGGTIPYMSPEHLRAAASLELAAAVEAPADIFALGVTLYHLLSGRLPFGDLPVELEQSQLAAELLVRQTRGPDSLLKFRPRMDPELARIIERCLAFEPGRRPVSAAALASELEQLLAPQRRVWRAVRRNRRAVLALLLVSGAGLLGGAYAVAARNPFVEDQYQRGWAAYGRGDFADGVREFTLALAEEPHNPDLLFGRGRAYMQAGEHQLALADFKTAAERTDDWRAHACLSYVYFWANHNFRSGLAHIERAAALQPENGAIQNNLGLCRIELGLVAEAIPALRKADKLLPGSPPILFNLAFAELQEAVSQHRPPRVQVVENAIRQGPVSAELHLQAASTYAWAAGFATAETRDGCKAKVVDHSAALVKLGFNPLELENVTKLCPELADDPQMARLRQLPPGTTPPVLARCLDPLVDHNTAIRLTR